MREERPRNAPRRDDARSERPPRRPFATDKPRGSFDRDQRPYRPSGPGPRRDDAGGDRPRRDYSSDRPARPYDSDRPRGNFDRDSRPARPFTPRDDNAGGDRPRREFNSDRPRFQDRGRPERYAPPPRPEVKPVNIWTDTTAVTLSCARGLAAFVAQEAVELGYTVVGGNETMVGIEGLKGVRDILRLSLWLRTAHRVLIPVAQGSVANLMDLYQLAVGVPWESYISADRPFLINSTVWNDTVRDSRMPNLKTKDAIADRMREFCGRRPDSGEDIGGASIFVYWIEEDAKIYLDVSGRPLSKRGYRMNPWKAPMMESLAAAAVMATGWDKKSPFIVPMCGSGTPAIEAALIARNRAPGQFRSWFGFMGMKGYESVIPGERADSSTRTRFGATPEQIWKQMVLQARDEELKGPMPVIIAGDIDEEAVSAAQSNAISAGVIDDIRFVTCDFAEMPLPEEKGTLFINPEYGERLGEETELEPVYARIGDYFKQKCIGWNGCVFTGNLELAKKIRLRTSRRIPMFNGPIECRLLVYELFEGLMDEQAE